MKTGTWKDTTRTQTQTNQPYGVNVNFGDIVVTMETALVTHDVNGDDVNGYWTRLAGTRPWVSLQQRSGLQLQLQASGLGLSDLRVQSSINTRIRDRRCTPTCHKLLV